MSAPKGMGTPHVRSGWASKEVMVWTASSSEQT